MGPSDLTKWIDLGKPENVKGRPSAQHRRDGLTVPPERRATRKSATRSKNHLWFPPVVFPFYRTYHVLRQSSAACKALKVLKTTVLKRLASAVQLGPCPPCFQALAPLKTQITFQNVPKNLRTAAGICLNKCPSRVGEIRWRRE